jgi:hypothetical protein
VITWRRSALTTLAANQLAFRVLPDDMLGHPSHQFSPLG